jgi:small subunit ribosomal protein S18
MRKTSNRPKRTGKRRRSLLQPGESISYKKEKILLRFLSEQKKILSRRVTRFTAKQQRALTRAIKEARVLAMLPFLNHKR